MEQTKIIEVSITSLRFEQGDEWLKKWAVEHGDTIEQHPIYLALRGDFRPLERWCDYRKDIWVMERLDWVFSVYRSLIRFGQIEPIQVKEDMTIITGHKRACCMLIMGKEKMKAIVI